MPRVDSKQDTAKDCRISDIVIAPFTIGERCRAARVIVDRRVLRHTARMLSISRDCRSEPKRSRPRGGIDPGVPDRTIVRAVPRAAPDDEAGKSFDGNPED